MKIFKLIKNAVINKLITEALEELPEIKKKGLNYLDSHKDEFVDFIFEKIKIAIKDFIAKKVNQAKDKIVKMTDSSN